jgi:hypothetical protein
MKKTCNQGKKPADSKLLAAQKLLRSQHGEGFVDTAIKF